MRSLWSAVSAGSSPKHAIHVHTLAGIIFVGLVLTIPRRLWSKAPLTTRTWGPFVHFLWRWGFPALGIEVLSVGIMFLVLTVPYRDDPHPFPLVRDTDSPLQAIQHDTTYDHVWITSRTLIRLSLIGLLSMGLAHIGIVLWLRT